MLTHPLQQSLILLRIVRFDGFGLDDHRRVASGEGAAFGGDGSGDIAGRQSESHGDSRGDGQCQVLDGFHEPLFLGFGQFHSQVIGQRLKAKGERTLRYRTPR